MRKHFCLWATWEIQEIWVQEVFSPSPTLTEPFISGEGLENISMPHGLIFQSCVWRWIWKLPKGFQVFPNTIAPQADHLLFICFLWQMEPLSIPSVAPKPLMQPALQGYTGSCPGYLPVQVRGPEQGAQCSSRVTSWQPRGSRDWLSQSQPGRWKRPMVKSNTNPSIPIPSWESLQDWFCLFFCSLHFYKHKSSRQHT